MGPVGPGGRPVVGQAGRCAADLVRGEADLVKYTLAALDAAVYEPTFGDLYVAAANRLHDSWWGQPDDGFVRSAG